MQKNMKLKFTFVVLMLLALSTSAQSQQYPNMKGGTICRTGASYYFYGGQKQDGTKSDKLYMINPVTFEAVEVFTPNLTPPAMSGHCAVPYDNKMVVLSGARGVTCTAMYTYDPNDNTWEEGGEQPFSERTEAAACVVEGEPASWIHIIGGRNPNGTEVYGDVHLYNPATGGWLTRDALPGGRYGHSLVQHNQKVYVLGGRNNNGDQAQVWSLDQYGWGIENTGGDFMFPRLGAQCTQLPSGMGFIAGGTSTSSYKSTKSDEITFRTDFYTIDLTTTPITFKKRATNLPPQAYGVAWVTIENSDTLFYTFGGISQISTEGDTTLTNSFYRYNINENLVQQYNAISQTWGSVISSINECEFSKNLNLQVYPNPATTEVNLTIPNNETIESIKIYNQNGQLIKQITKPDKSSINVSDLITGLYFIRTDCKTTRYLSKLIKK
jgi:hypothetical protein